MLNQRLCNEIFEKRWAGIVRPGGEWDWNRVKWVLASYSLLTEYGPQGADARLYGPGEKIEMGQPPAFH